MKTVSFDRDHAQSVLLARFHLMEGEIGIVDMGLYHVMPPHAFQTLTFLVGKALRVSTIK